LTRFSDIRATDVVDIGFLSVLLYFGAFFKRFLEERYPSRNRRKLSLQLWKENWLEKALSLGLAIGLWIVFFGRDKNS
jgi:hypothetical protein